MQAQGQSTQGPSTGVGISQVVMAQQQEQDVQSAITMGTAIRADTENAGSAMTRRRLMAIQTSARNFTGTTTRYIMQVQNITTERDGACELDSHANTCVIGANCIVLEHTGDTVNISGFSNALQGAYKDVPIIKAVTAYDDHLTGITYILVLGQVLYLPNEIDHTLLCPNQLRYHGIEIDECPKHLAPRDKPSTHSIFVPEGNLCIPLRLKGPVSLFDTRTPTYDEISSCKWVVLTGDKVWDPHSPAFHEEEEKMDFVHDVVNNCNDRQLMSLLSIKSSSSPFFDDYHLISRNIHVATTGKKPSVSKEQLARGWGIGIQTAKKTIQVTTQRGIRQIEGHLERRLKTKQAHSRYPHLNRRHGRFYTDTFFVSAPSLRGMKCVQLYTNDIGLTKVYPMGSKSDAHETLNVFIHEVGIPQEIHSDNAKELAEGYYKKICRDYGIKTTYSEPHSPWQNRAEAGIRELKRHVHRKMKARHVPRIHICSKIEPQQR